MTLALAMAAEVATILSEQAGNDARYDGSDTPDQLIECEFRWEHHALGGIWYQVINAFWLREGYPSSFGSRRFPKQRNYKNPAVMTPEELAALPRWVREHYVGIMESDGANSSS